MVNIHQLYKYYYILTCIGTIFHEIAHKKFAEGRGLEIINVTYFSLKGGSLGEVTHSPPKSYMDVFVVNVAPFIFNTGLAVLAFGLVITTTEIYTISPILKYSIIGLTIWFSGSLLLQAFPSSVDVSNILDTSKFLWDKRKPNILIKFSKFVASRNIILKVLFYPILLIINTLYALIFSILHLKIILTLPITIVLHILDRTRKFGSHIYFTLGMLILTHQEGIPILLRIYNVIKPFVV